MPRAAVPTIELEYECFGDPTRPPVVLIMGLGAQMIAWEEELCAALAARGRYVVRFDNRDVGLSTRLHGVKAPPLWTVMARAAAGLTTEEVPYRLRDMAADVVGLLDALGLASAHIVGLSMGGMIAQELAIGWPGRVRTLTSIMSSTGEAGLPLARPAAAATLMTPLPKERGAYVAAAVEVLAVLAGAGHPLDRVRARARVERAYDRAGGLYPAGFQRQLTAILASGSRREALAAVRAPTLVIHGDDDPLVPLAAGEATARAIPGARLLVIPGMGHDLPQGTWPQIIDALVAHTQEGG